MRRRLLLLGLLIAGWLLAAPVSANTLFVSLAWGQPGTAVLFWQDAPANACAYRIAPVPRVKLACAKVPYETTHTLLLREGDKNLDLRPTKGMQITLEQTDGTVLATRTLGPFKNDRYLPRIVVP
jgi:hypothetical protein